LGGGGGGGESRLCVVSRTSPLLFVVKDCDFQ
jgi:hypothetical protein